MPVRSRLSEWAAQPQGATALDASNPRNAGMLRAVHAPAGAFDISTGGDLTLESGVTITSGRHGVAFEFNGSTTGLTVPISVAGPFTITVFGETDTASGTRNFCSLGDGTAYAVQLRQDGANWSYYQFESSDKLTGETAGVTARAPVLLHAVWDGSTARLYRDGVQRASTAVASIRAVSALKIGQDNFGAKQALTGRIYYLSVQAGALSAADVRDDSVDLWGRFAPRVVSIPARFSAGASLAPDAGSIALAGYAPSVAQTANRAMAPGVGNLSITGYAPSIAQSGGTQVAPNAGALALAGYAPAVTQSAHQALAPAPGALAITGHAPTVTQVSASNSAAPGAGYVQITGYAPSVVQSGSIPGLGWVGKMRRRHLDDDDEKPVVPPAVVVAFARIPEARRRTIALSDLIGSTTAENVSRYDLEIAVQAYKRKKRRADDEMLMLM